MGEHDEYPDFRRWASCVYTGSLNEAVISEMNWAQENASSVSRRWWAYEGQDTDPFALYTRWQPGRVTIASIAGLGSQKGRIPLICAAFEATGLAVRWEAVGNRHLRYSLRRRGYQSDQQEPCFSADLVLKP